MLERLVVVHELRVQPDRAQLRALLPGDRVTLQILVADVQTAEEGTRRHRGKSGTLVLCVAPDSVGTAVRSVVALNLRVALGR